MPRGARELTEDPRKQDLGMRLKKDESGNEPNWVVITSNGKYDAAGDENISLSTVLT